MGWFTNTKKCSMCGKKLERGRPLPGRLKGWILLGVKCERCEKYICRDCYINSLPPMYIEGVDKTCPYCHSALGPAVE